jgi:hypothetical protein
VKTLGSLGSLCGNEVGEGGDDEEEEGEVVARLFFFLDTKTPATTPAMMSLAIVSKVPII